MCAAVVNLSTTNIPPMYYRILSKFPQNVIFCFGYGSGVKKQMGYNKAEPMIDMIFCVDNSYRWHETNLAQNSSHYSVLKYWGHNFIAKFQEQFGAKVYFNTLVPIPDENIMLKYGVISCKDLVTDLLDWSDLYLAGRMHKPVTVVKATSNAQLQAALHLNLHSAVHAALLLLPEFFTEYELYYTICNLSYSGDFRMLLGEDKNKVRNIVLPQMEEFRILYKPVLQAFQTCLDFPPDKAESARIRQDISPLVKLHHLNQLPKNPQKGIVRYWNRGNFQQDTEDVLRAVAYDPYCGEVVKNSVKNIVWKSSISQSLKGIATAGFIKSIKYGGRKLLKTFI